VASHSTKPQRVAFSRPFSDLLVELSIALQKFVMYPDGHPLLEPAAAAVVRRAERIMEDRPTIAFGVARHQLIIEGVATDPKQPVLRRLADSLNRHHLGAISLSRGVKPNEIAEALRQVGAETNTVVPIGLRPLHELPSWPHLRLHPLTFDRLALVTDGSATAAKSADDTRAMELWIGLATAAMTTGRPQDGSPVPTEPAVIARAIDEHERVEAYDQVIVGYLQQIARELKDASSAESAALRRRTARLLASLKPETVRHLVEMGGDFAQRRAFVLDAAHGMAVDSVLGIVQAAADASGQVISRGLIRMLTKLAMHAEAGPQRAREMASGALREQIDQLMTGWELTDPIPAEHSRLLHRLATEESPQLSRAEGDRAPDGDSDLARIVQMSLEVDSTGILLDQAIDRAVDEGAVETILNLLVSAPSGSGATIDAILTRLTHPDSIARLVAREPVDVLLCARHDVPSSFSAEPWTRHPDVRVSYEAIRLQLAIPGERTQAIRASLAAADPRSVRLGLAAVQEECPSEVAGDVVNVAKTPDAPEELRTLAVRALRHVVPASHDPRILDVLLATADGGTTLLGRTRLAPPTSRTLAALAALNDHWSNDARASTLLALARASEFPDVRRAAGGTPSAA